MGVLNLEDQLVFYRSYHYNNLNVAIHLLFIPTIYFSFIGAISSIHFDPYINLPGFIQEPYATFINKHVLNLGSVITIGYSIFYILLDRVGGAAFSSVIIAVAYYLQKLYDYYPADLIVKTEIATHIIAWLFQFAGHAFFEHRAPALLDNVLQPLVLAPFFVFYEIVFFLGFRKDLKRKMDARAQIQIKEFQAKQT